MRTHFLFQRGPITSTWEGGICQKLHMQTKNQESWVNYKISDFYFNGLNCQKYLINEMWFQIVLDSYEYVECKLHYMFNIW